MLQRYEIDFDLRFRSSRSGGGRISDRQEPVSEDVGGSVYGKGGMLMDENMNLRR